MIQVVRASIRRSPENHRLRGWSTHADNWGMDATDHSEESPENQAQEAAPEAAQAATPKAAAPAKAPRAAPAEAPVAPSFVSALKDRVKAVDEILIEKERLQLSYVFAKVPRPFYARWKEEANEVFSLRVTLKRRRFRA